MVEGHRGDYGHHCPLLFGWALSKKFLCGPGEAGKLMEQGQEITREKKITLKMAGDYCPEKGMPDA